MHLRDGKVLGARSGDSRAMAEPKKAAEPRLADSSVESDNRSHHNNRNPTPLAVQHENVHAPLRGDPRDELILQMGRDSQLLKGTVGRSIDMPVSASAPLVCPPANAKA